VAIAANTAGFGSAELSKLAGKIAVAVPRSKIPASYKVSSPKPLND